MGCLGCGLAVHSQSCNALFCSKSTDIDFHGAILHRFQFLAQFLQHLLKQFCKMLFRFGHSLNDLDEPSRLMIFLCPTGLQLFEVLQYFPDMSCIDLSLVWQRRRLEKIGPIAEETSYRKLLVHWKLHRQCHTLSKHPFLSRKKEEL